MPWPTRYLIVLPVVVVACRSAAPGGASTRAAATPSAPVSAVAGMPEGWSAPGPGSGAVPEDYEVGLDRTVRHGGSASAYIKSKAAAPRGFMALVQGFQAETYRGKRIRLSGYVMTKDVADTAGLWMQVQGGGGATGFDNMQNRPIRGTSDWTKYDVVLDVPANSVGITFGFLLQGRGQAWVDDVRFDVVGTDVPSTNTMPAPEADSTKAEAQARGWASSPKQPVNLDFERVKP